MDAIITAIVSGKGGTGKSTTAVFCGAALARLGQKVVVVELAPGMRSVDIIAGASDKAVFDIDDVLTGRIPPDKAAVEVEECSGLFIMPASYTAAYITQQSVKQLCTQLRPYFNFILLDVATGFGTPFKAATAIAHRALLVETPDIVSLRDGRALADMISGHIAYIRLILNKVKPERVLSGDTLRDLDEAIDTVGVQLIGVIPESDAILKASSGGKTLLDNSREAAVYTAIAKRLLGEDVKLVIQ